MLEVEEGKGRNSCHPALTQYFASAQVAERVLQMTFDDNYSVRGSAFYTLGSTYTLAIAASFPPDS